MPYSLESRLGTVAPPRAPTAAAVAEVEVRRCQAAVVAGAASPESAPASWGRHWAGWDPAEVAVPLAHSRHLCPVGPVVRAGAALPGLRYRRRVHHCYYRPLPVVRAEAGQAAG